MQTMPLIIETVGRNKKTFDIPTKLYEKNIITLFDEISDDTSYLIITQLIYLDTLDSDENIKLYVNSPGGSVTAGLAIIDTIESMNRKVDTVGVGSCASMGAMLLMCGTGTRKALKSTRIMLHSVSGGGHNGTVQDQIISLEETKFLQEELMNKIAKRSNLSLKKAKELTARDYYISSKEAVKNGIIDEVVAA